MQHGLGGRVVRNRSNRRRSRRWLVALSLAGALLASQQASADAVYATGGTGKYRNEILWLTWGGGATGTHAQALAAGATSTANIAVANGETLVVTCTLSNPSGTLNSYRPGNYSGDALDDLYNIGGTGAANQLISGISVPNGTTRTFTIGCSATLNGAAYSIPGLAIADAESLESGSNNGVATESIAGAAIGSWDVVEMNRVTGRTYFASQTASGATQTMLFGPGGQGTGTSPAAIAFLTFDAGAYNGASRAVSMDFSMKGGGITAMSIGLLVPRADFGDAPASYGIAAHLFYAFTPLPDSPALGATATDINSTAFTLGGLGPLSTNLLGTVGPDGEQTTSTPAGTGDDGYGIAGANEENGFPTTPAITTAAANGTLTRTIPCSSNGTVAGWIDFDLGGTFDADERASAVCSGGSATLAWTVPNDIAVGASYVRLRFATSSADVAQATGTSVTGEVEDRLIQITAGSADLQITKTNTPASGASDQASDTVVSGAATTYQLVVTNLGTDAATGAVVKDTPGAGLTCPPANPVTCTSTASPSACPSAAQTVSSLQTGVTLGTLPATTGANVVTLSFSCTVL